MSKHRIVVTYKTDEKDESLFKEKLSSVSELVFLKNIEKQKRNKNLENADILIAWNPSRELNELDHKLLKNVKFVQLLSAGYDHINFDIFPKDCMISSNAGAYAKPMAEHILAMILALSKNLLSKHKKMSEGIFDQLSLNKRLEGSKCGIIGFGGIGKETTKLLRTFNVDIYAINTSGKTDEAVEFIGTLKDLNYVIKESDIIIISIPLNDKTRGMISKKELELMKKNAMIINVARGAIINQEDLFNHLKTHPEFQVGIDAWWSEPFKDGSFKLDFPFLDLPNVLGSPHNSAIVPEGIFEGSKRVADNVLKYINGKKVERLINRNN
jgi:phosphoglycerate dehydrogenase-like enzyme